jgi:hypothetical protein
MLLRRCGVEMCAGKHVTDKEGKAQAMWNQSSDFSIYATQLASRSAGQGSCDRSVQPIVDTTLELMELFTRRGFDDCACCGFARGSGAGWWLLEQLAPVWKVLKNRVKSKLAMLVAFGCILRLEAILPAGYGDRRSFLQLRECGGLDGVRKTSLWVAGRQGLATIHSPELK